MGRTKARGWATLVAGLMVGTLAAACADEGGAAAPLEFGGMRVRFAAATVCGTGETLGAEYPAEQIPPDVTTLRVQVEDVNTGKVVKLVPNIQVRPGCQPRAEDCVSPGVSTNFTNGRPLYVSKVPRVTGRLRVVVDALNAGGQVVWRGANDRVIPPSGSGDALVELLLKRVSGMAPAYECMGTARAFHASVVLRDGSVLIIGGTDQLNPGAGDVSADMVATTKVERFNPNTGRFTPMAALPQPRMMLSAALLVETGEVLIVGGAARVKRKQPSSALNGDLFTAESGDIPSTFLIYDPDSANPANPAERGRVTSVEGDNNVKRFNARLVTFPVASRSEPLSVYLLLGGHDGSQKVATMAVYNHVIQREGFFPLRKFTGPPVVPQMLTPRAGHTVTPYQDSTTGLDALVVIGGNDPGTPAVEWLIDPTRPFIEVKNTSGQTLVDLPTIAYHAAAPLQSFDALKTDRPPDDLGIVVYGGVRRTGTNAYELPGSADAPGVAYFLNPRVTRTGAELTGVTTGVSNMSFPGSKGLFPAAAHIDVPAGAATATSAPRQRRPIFAGGAVGNQFNVALDAVGFLADVAPTPTMRGPGPDGGGPAIRLGGGRWGATAERLRDGSVMFIGGLRQPPAGDPSQLQVPIGGVELYMPPPAGPGVAQ